MDDGRAAPTGGELEFLELLPAAAGYFSREPDGTCRPLYVNAVMTDLLGRTGEELAAFLAGDAPEELIHPEDAEKVSLALYKAGVSGGRFLGRARIRTREGVWRWMGIELSAEPRVGGGCMLCFLLRDIHTGMEQQQKMDRTYLRLLDVMNNTPGGIVVFDMVNNRTPVPSFVSMGMDRLLRGTAAELADAYRKDPFQCVHPEDRARFLHTVEDAMRNLSGFRMDLRLRTIPGDYVWVSASATVDNGEGQRTLYMAFVDASAGAESAYIQRQILRSFVRRQYDHICYIDGKHNSYRVLSSQNTADPFLPEQGTDFERDVAALIRRSVVPEEQEEILALMSLRRIFAALEEQEEAEYFCTVSYDGGKCHYKRIWLSWIDRETRAVAFVTGDVTEEHRRSEESRTALRTALRAAEQANIAKSEFLSRMSHDIRTPLNAIIGYTEMSLECSGLCDEVREHLTKADAASKFLLSLINDVLNMSRIESGKLALREEAFSLPAFLDGVTAVVASQCAAKRIRYNCGAEPGVRPAYMGDPLKLQQVLLNILSNAVKFTPEGGEIELRALAVPDSAPPLLRFTVRDTGCGISPEFLPHLFDPFAQERRSLDSEIRGTGLGLAICKSLVGMMGGVIGVESRVGAGSVFTVDLPLRPADGQTGSVPRGPVPRPEELRNFGGRRVLLCEDNELNMEIARHVLERVNLTVDSAQNGREACERFAASPEGYYAAVLMDVRMPVMDGLEATRQIRAMERPDACVPIIAMSANAFDEDVNQALSAGMNAYTVKPIDVQQLYTALRRYIP